MKANTALVSLLLPLFCGLLITCTIKNEDNNNTDQQIKSAEVKEAEKALKEINLETENAVLKGDYDSILKYYTSDVIIAHMFKPAIRGIDSLKANYAEMKKKGVKYHSFNAITEKLLVCGNRVFEYGTYGLSVSSKETDHPYAFSGSYFSIWEKQSDSRYLMKYVISNLDFNPCEYFK